jgi:hypothetical protein
VCLAALGRCSTLGMPGKSRQRIAPSALRESRNLPFFGLSRPWHQVC